MKKFYLIIFIVFIFLGFLIIKFSLNTLAKFDEMDRVSEENFNEEINDIKKIKKEAEK